MKGRVYQDGISSGQHDLSCDERRVELGGRGYRFGQFRWSSVLKHLTQRKAEQHRGPQRQSATASNRGLERSPLPRPLSSALADELTTAPRPYFSPWPFVILAFISVLKSFGSRNERGRLQSVTARPPHPPTALLPVAHVDSLYTRYSAAAPRPRQA
jgi:hypothetical protein